LPRADGGEETGPFGVGGVGPLEGARNDANLTPQVRGIPAVRGFREWDPPFPYDNSRIRRGDANERYWDEHRTAPKAYVTLKTGQSLWRSRFGDLTSFRVRPPAGPDPVATVAKKLAGPLHPPP